MEYILDAANLLFTHPCVSLQVKCHDVLEALGKPQAARTTPMQLLVCQNSCCFTTNSEGNVLLKMFCP